MALTLNWCISAFRGTYVFWYFCIVGLVTVILKPSQYPLSLIVKSHNVSNPNDLVCFDLSAVGQDLFCLKVIMHFKLPIVRLIKFVSYFDLFHIMNIEKNAPRSSYFCPLVENSWSLSVTTLGIVIWNRRHPLPQLGTQDILVKSVTSKLKSIWTSCLILLRLSYWDSCLK